MFHSVWRRFYRAALALLLLGAGCRAHHDAGAPVVQAAAIESVLSAPSYRLRRGETVRHPAPYPAYTPIYVENLPGAPASSRLGFRAWDFNGDERFDMVEVLRLDGTVQAAVYDYDFDGIVDATKPREMSAADTDL